MRIRMWSYDLAREQCPTYEHLEILCQTSLDSGFNALGLYLEHRFAYPSLPWMAGEQALQPSEILRLQKQFPELRLIPLINLLGHMEGFLYCETGVQYAEARFQGMQACPSKPEFVALAETILSDTIASFESEIIHIGGDETWQLGQCPVCADKVRRWQEEGKDGKAELYGRHFGLLAQKVVDAGRRPAVWGDMFLEHPTALDHLPESTLIFDWQYFHGPAKTSETFRQRGFDTVFCPALLTYDAAWMHLPQSESNVRDHVAAAKELNAEGICVTTWECALMGNYETLLPAIEACGRMIEEVPAGPSSEESDFAALADLRDAPYFLASYLSKSERYEEWARLMGVELQNAGGLFAFSGIRSSLKCRLLLYSNPFLLWLRNREDLLGEPGDIALDVCERAQSVAPDAATRGISEFITAAIQFTRHVEVAHCAYAEGRVGEAAADLIPCRQIFDNLAITAKATNLRIGGSLADIERCRIAKEQVERVMRRVKDVGAGALGYRPSFEVLTHPKFVPHDQTSWWLINTWANE